jgi:hypothetical protein
MASTHSIATVPSRPRSIVRSATRPNSPDRSSSSSESGSVGTVESSAHVGGVGDYSVNFDQDNKRNMAKMLEALTIMPNLVSAPRTSTMKIKCREVGMSTVKNLMTALQCDPQGLAKLCAILANRQNKHPSTLIDSGSPSLNYEINAQATLIIIYMTGGIGTTNSSRMLGESGLTTVTSQTLLEASVAGTGITIQWLTNFLQTELLQDVDLLRAFIAKMGPIFSKWVITHSAAGSSGFSRILRLNECFGLETMGPVKLYFECLTIGFIAGFGISTLSDSVSNKKLLGVLMSGSFRRVAACCNKSSGAWQKCYATSLRNALAAALSAVKDTDIVKETVGVLPTMKNASARAGFIKSLDESKGFTGSMMAETVKSFEGLSTEAFPFAPVTRAQLNALRTKYKLEETPEANYENEIVQRCSQALRDIWASDGFLQCAFQNYSPEDCTKVSEWYNAKTRDNLVVALSARFSLLGGSVYDLKNVVLTK